jgi:hypothetical protein
LRGTFLSLWDEILPPIPESQWRENLAMVAAWLEEFGGRALAEPTRIDWKAPAHLADLPTALEEPVGTAGPAGDASGEPDAATMDGPATVASPAEELAAASGDAPSDGHVPGDGAARIGVTGRVPVQRDEPADEPADDPTEAARDEPVPVPVGAASDASDPVAADAQVPLGESPQRSGRAGRKRQRLRRR